jgi:arylsulfatase A-like enzyme
MYEGGVREPMIVHWPGKIPSGTTCSVPVSSPDIYPTVLELAGLNPAPEQHTDGRSLKPLLEGGESLDRDALFWHFPHYGNQGGTPGASIRMGDWKLIEFFEDNRLELYNLREDISESHNNAEDEPERTAAMHARLKSWQEEMNAKFPVPNENWGEHAELA